MTTREHLEKHDREIRAIKDLVREGVRLMIETRKDLRALTLAQKRTEASLKAFIDSMRTCGKGAAVRRPYFFIHSSVFRIPSS